MWGVRLKKIRHPWIVTSRGSEPQVRACFALCGRLTPNSIPGISVRPLPSILILPFLLSSAAVLPRTTEQGPVVHLSSGSLRGYWQGTTAVFKGIPYAAPPLGDLRWREPQPPASWSGVCDATKPASACVQDPAGLGPFIQPLAATYGASYEIKPVSSSEDCLYLNIWTPMWPPRGPLPVMVWLHGFLTTLGYIWGIAGACLARKESSS
jgi:hypothetical protein